jgi:hypothetical protein
MLITTGSDPELTQEPVCVVITDIKLPFGSMVTVMVKGAFAAVPAIIIVGWATTLITTIATTILRNL